MEVLVLDGKNYVKASKAARDLGYATDYVGQLARTGQIDAHLIGRTWYVDAEKLGHHRIEKKRISRVKAREQARRSITIARAEQETQSAEQANKSARKLAISYESDTAPLIPETRTLAVASERYSMPAIENTPETTVINKGEKIRWTGDLHVVDVTDIPLEEDTTVLHPKILHRQPKDIREAQEALYTRQQVTVDASVQSDIENGDSSQDASDQVVSEERKITVSDEIDERYFQKKQAITSNIGQPRSNFKNRLQPAVQPVEGVQQPQEPTLATRDPVATEANAGSFWPYALVLTLILLGILATLPLYTAVTYDASRTQPYERHTAFSLEKVVFLLNQSF